MCIAIEDGKPCPHSWRFKVGRLHLCTKHTKLAEAGKIDQRTGVVAR